MHNVGRFWLVPLKFAIRTKNKSINIVERTFLCLSFDVIKFTTNPRIELTSKTNIGEKIIPKIANIIPVSETPE